MQTNISLKIFKETLIKKNIKICVAESITGGSFASKIVNEKGASSILDYSVVCYSNDSKKSILKINKEIIKYGVVSAKVAELMVKRISYFSNHKKILALSCTGQAGPKKLNEIEEIGTVFFGVGYKNSLTTKKKKFKSKNRREIIKLSVQEMINLGFSAIQI